MIPAIAFPAQVTIPDQRALICWSNGVERLAIETQFNGEGTNFAWVVPLPGKPVIEEATPGLFTTLEYIFRPNLVHNVAPLYALLLACAGVAYLLIVIRRNTPPRISDTLISAGTALVLMPISPCLGFPLLVLLPYTVWRVRSGKESPWLIVVVLFLVFLMSSMLLPALGTAGMGVSESGVSVLSHQTVGVYDTTTITAKEPGALVEWLRTNGYAVSPAAGKVITNYVKRGWVFAAAKLRREMAGHVSDSPHPLCFTFESEKAVYPVQLTGVGNTNLTVELFVFGPSRADAKFFHAGRCTVPIFGEDYSYGLRRRLRVVHPLLNKWVAGSPVATKLSAILTPEMMTEDVELQWAPFAEIRRENYSYQGACISGLNYGASVFVAGLLLAAIAVAIKRALRPHLKLMAGWLAIAGTITAVFIFVAVPKVDVRLTRRPVMFSILNLRDLADLFANDSLTNRASSIVEARAALKKIQNSNPKLVEENPLLGGPVREEDSPGNYVLRETTNGVGFFWFDVDGGEHSADR